MTDFTPKVSEWLANFSAALDRLDFDGAVRLFADESYWRDLVSFTWNIKTAEGKENIKAMLEATLPHVKPSKWQIEGEVTEDGGRGSSLTSVGLPDASDFRPACATAVAT